MVQVDITALRSIEREKEISFDTIIDALETALLTAYKHTPHSMPHARVAIDRGTGDVVVWAQELGPDGELLEEYDDTPTDFGRVAAMTARQVILQRLRDAEHDQTFGEYSGREGDIVTGVIQADAQAAQRGLVLVDIGKVEAILPQSEQVPGEQYSHGTRLKCYVVGVTRGMRGPQVTVSRTHPNLVRKLFALEVPEIADGSVEIVGVAREAGHRTKIAVRTDVAGLNAKGACIGPMGQRVRNVVAELHGEKIDIIDYARRSGHLRGQRPVPGPRPGDPCGRRGGPVGPGRGARLPAVARDRARGAECPACRPVDRLAHRHPQRRRNGRFPRTPAGRAAGQAAGRAAGPVGRSGGRGVD